MGRKLIYELLLYILCCRILQKVINTFNVVFR